MARYTIGLLGLVVLVAGCASTIQIDRGHFALAYADLKAHYEKAAMRVEQLCKAGKLEKDDCTKAAVIDRDVRKLEREVRRVIIEPSKQPDWEKIREYSELLLSLAAKVAF